MMTAEEARKLSDKAQEQQRCDANKWVENEAEFVENKIFEAIEKGKYETSYQWSKELLNEVGVAISAAREILHEYWAGLGFYCEANISYTLNEKKLTLYLNWENQDE